MGSEQSTHSVSRLARGLSLPATRLLTFAALLLVQIAIVSFLFYFPVALAEWSNPVSHAKKGVHLAVLAVAVFALAAWPRRAEILHDWIKLVECQNWRLSVLANLCIFSVLTISTIAFSRHVATASEPPWIWFGAYCCLLLANAGSLALIAAPAGFWPRLPRLAPVELALAISGALLVLMAEELSRGSWGPLSSATLHVAAWILSLYQTDVFVDLGRKLVAVRDFRVIITPECSGYEGIGLVTAFLALYLWIFRSELRFPNALLLLPLGVAAIWLLNAARIAALVSIGAHLSPSVAADGFHSQAGWIAFLLVTVGLMAVSHRSSYFRQGPWHAQPAATGSNRVLHALLLPFIALMASSIVAHAFAPNEQWLYSLKVVAVGAVIWLYRDIYADLAAKPASLSILVGLALGAIWIVTDPEAASESPLKRWLDTLPLATATVWIAFRAFGSIVLIPLAEELAFRGYLHRALIARRFETVPQGRFSWLAFIVSSVLFGLMHQRWLAGMLAGAVFAILMYRMGKLSDPIAAHMSSNAVIVFWAVAAGQWSLL